MIIRNLIIFAFITLGFNAKAQVCHFCTEDELKILLKENNIDYIEKNNFSNDIVLVNTNTNYIKNWYIKYNKCYLYEIIVLNKEKIKPLISIIEKFYNKIDDNDWEDLDTKVELISQNNDSTKIQFIPKITFNNLNNNN